MSIHTSFVYRVATVGYGDQVPDVNNILAVMTSSIIMIFGALYLAMPLAIIGLKYEMTWSKFEAEKKMKVLTAGGAPTTEIQKHERERSMTADLTAEYGIETLVLSGKANRVNIRFFQLCEQMSGLALEAADYTTSALSTEIFLKESTSQDNTNKFIETLLRTLKAHKQLTKEIKPFVPRDLQKQKQSSKSGHPSSLGNLFNTSFKKSFVNR